MTLIGRDGAEEITVDDLAGWAGTVSYEILCGISKRVPRILRDAPRSRHRAMSTAAVGRDDAPSSVDGAPGGDGRCVADARDGAGRRRVTPIMLGYLGRAQLLLLGQRVGGLFRTPFRLRLFLEQMEFVGVGSLPIICLVGFFSGAVSAQQAIAALRIFNQERFVGATVGISLAQELAPVFTAPHDHGARRLGHGHRARVDAHHRADRRADDLRRRSDPVPGHARGSWRRS